MKCVILAGGLGTRLAEETTKIPKPMVEIGGYPILWHIMKIYGAHGITEFIVCLGYRGYVIKEYFANFFLHNSDATVDLATGDLQITRSNSEPWKIHLIDTGQESMTGGRLRRILPLVADDDAFCLTYGDGVADIDISREIAFHRDHGKLATVAAVAPAAALRPARHRGRPGDRLFGKAAGRWRVDQWRVLRVVAEGRRVSGR